MSEFAAYLNEWKRKKLAELRAVRKGLAERDPENPQPLRVVTYHCRDGKCGRCFSCKPRWSVPVALKDL